MVSTKQNQFIHAFRCGTMSKKDLCSHSHMQGEKKNPWYGIMIMNKRSKVAFLLIQINIVLEYNNLLDFFRGSLLFSFEGVKTGSATDLWEADARIAPKFLMPERLHSLFDRPSSTLKAFKINFIERFLISGWQLKTFISQCDWVIPVAWWKVAAAILRIHNIPSDNVSTQWYNYAA